MTKNNFAALPLFDTIEHIKQQSFPTDLPENFKNDFIKAKEFLQSYAGNHATFNAYRREVERLLHWSWLIAQKSICKLGRQDIESYIAFCQNPPITWIGLTKVPRFIVEDGLRKANPIWRPFVATVTKSAFRRGILPDQQKYSLSTKAVREIFTITSSFFNFLMQENHTEINPVQQLRQKSRYFTKVQGKAKIRRLSTLQWSYVIETAEKMALDNPDKYQKTFFMMTALYAMYLRISELAASKRWSPRMCDFYCDQDNLWWFNVIGKGNKQRQIAVSDQMLNALKIWRKHLNLTALPSPTDESPLLPKIVGKGPIKSTGYLRKIVQKCFDHAIEQLKSDGFHEDAEALLEATVHWLRHTGISDDVKRRPREHVRDDAGHSSSAITDKYIDIELRERHATAKKKPMHEDS